MYAYILLVEMLEATETVRMEDHQNGHHLGIRQSAGLVAVRSAVLELTLIFEEIRDLSEGYKTKNKF